MLFGSDRIQKARKPTGCSGQSSAHLSEYVESTPSNSSIVYVAVTLVCKIDLGQRFPHLSKVAPFSLPMNLTVHDLIFLKCLSNSIGIHIAVFPDRRVPHMKFVVYSLSSFVLVHILT